MNLKFQKENQLLKQLEINRKMEKVFEKLITINLFILK